MHAKPPLPPFTEQSAIQKIRMAEDAWNSRDPERVSLVYTEDSYWRNRAEFINGRQQVRDFLMNGMMIPATGIVHRVMKIGRLLNRV